MLFNRYGRALAITAIASISLFSGCKTSSEQASLSANSSDSDQDGVPDQVDKCPTTDRGDLVGADGCIDWDKKLKRLPVGCRDLSYSPSGAAISSKELIIKGLSGQCSWTGDYHHFTFRQFEAMKKQKKQLAIDSKFTIKVQESDLIELDQKTLNEPADR